MLGLNLMGLGDDLLLLGVGHAGEAFHGRWVLAQGHSESQRQLCKCGILRHFVHLLGLSMVGFWENHAGLKICEDNFQSLKVKMHKEKRGKSRFFLRQNVVIFGFDS